MGGRLAPRKKVIEGAGGGEGRGPAHRAAGVLTACRDGVVRPGPRPPPRPFPALPLPPSRGFKKEVLDQEGRIGAVSAVSTTVARTAARVPARGSPRHDRHLDHPKHPSDHPSCSQPLHIPGFFHSTKLWVGLSGQNLEGLLLRDLGDWSLHHVRIDREVASQGSRPALPAMAARRLLYF